MAMAGLSLAVSRGVSVPGQLSVTGYDDTEIAAHLQPSLTTVSTDVVAWGRAAATRLLELIGSRAHPRRPAARPASSCAPRPGPCPAGTLPDRTTRSTRPTVDELEHR